MLLTGVETVSTIGRETGAKGAAICASVSAGVFSDMKEAVKDIIKIDKRYTPNPENTKKYRKLYELYLTIREDSTKFWAKREEVMQQL